MEEMIDMNLLQSQVQRLGLKTTLDEAIITVHTDRCMHFIPGLRALLPRDATLLCWCIFCKDKKTRAERMADIERRRDNVLAEYNPDLPMYEAS